MFMKPRMSGAGSGMPGDAPAGVLSGADVHGTVDKDVERKTCPGPELQQSDPALWSVLKLHKADTSKGTGVTGQA
jgi:hypothetical protein